jgi:hypothetical protein
MATTKYLTKTQYSAAKARLTRAINSGNPHLVVDTVTAQYREWDNGDYAYPDDWHRWERAREDARFQLGLATW